MIVNLQYSCAPAIMHEFFTLESPLGDEMHHILNAAIILGGHLCHLVQEVISGVTHRGSEVTNPPGDHLLTRSRTNSLPVLLVAAGITLNFKDKIVYLREHHGGRPVIHFVNVVVVLS